MLVGLFEPVAAPWSLDGVPRGFSFGKLPPDWERMEPFLGPAMNRIPCAGRDRGADVLLRPGVVHLRRPAAARARARAGRLLRRGGPELAGHPVRRRGRQHGRALDRRRASPVDATAVAIDRTAAHETSRRFRAERTVEQLGVLFGDAVWPSWQPSTARNVRRSVLHDRLAAAGAHFGVSAGWEYAEWFDAAVRRRCPALDYRRRARTRSSGASTRRSARRWA